MKRLEKADVGQYVLYDGDLMQIMAIGEGRSITLRPVAGATCPTCGRHPDVNLMEHAPLFQEHVQPVPTISTHEFTTVAEMGIR